MPYQNFMILERGKNAKSQSIAAMSVFCPKTSAVAVTAFASTPAVCAMSRLRK
jgi:hypothetical protein